MTMLEDASTESNVNAPSELALVDPAKAPQEPRVLSVDLGPCPVCGAVLGRPITSCPDCRTAHHAECWSYNGGCSIYGCATRPDPETTGASDMAVRADVARSASLAMILVMMSMAMGLMVHRDHLRSHRSRCQSLARALGHVPPRPGLAPWNSTRTAPGVQFDAGVDRWVRSGKSGATRIQRDPFELPHSHGFRPVLGPSTGSALDVTVQTEEAQDVFGSFRIRAGSDRGTISWRTRKYVPACRLLLSRDGTWRGLDRVVDSKASPGGRRHKLVLDDLQPETTYYALVLVLGDNGVQGQSPVVTFRTPAAPSAAR